MDLIFIFFVFISGIVIGWSANARAITRKLLDDPERMIKILTEYKAVKAADSVRSEEDVRSIKVERHGESLYLFTKDTDEFLGQGKTLQEALDNVSSRFPGKNFNGNLSKEEADKLGITVK